MQYILPILKELGATTSRIEKEGILIREKDNDLLREFFEAACNPFRTYHIRQIPKYRTENEYMGASLHKAIKQLYIFENRVLTGNAAANKLADLLASLSGEDAQVFERIIKKDPNVNVGTATLNKIWPGLIPVFSYMGAVAMSDDALNGLDWMRGVYAQNKEDGQFLASFCKLGQGTATHFGRSGKEYDFQGAFDYLSEYFPNTRIDGEIRVWNEDFTAFLPRKASNGFTNRFQVGKKKPNVDVNRLCYIVWDVVPYAMAMDGYCDIPYETRISVLYGAVKDARTGLKESMFELRTRPELRMVKTEIVNSLEAAREMFKRTKRAGEEGLVLKNRATKWANGKPNDQVKMKNVSECEMKIIGFQEHSKRKDALGAFVLSSADGKIVTNCGSGIEKDESFDLWQRRDELLNSVVTIQFESIIWKEGEELLSMNLPVNPEIREDKDVADDLATIIKIWEADTGCTAEKEIYAKL